MILILLTLILIALLSPETAIQILSFCFGLLVWGAAIGLVGFIGLLVFA